MMSSELEIGEELALTVVWDVDRVASDREGLLRFSTVEETLDAVAENPRNDRHARAARRIAKYHFDARIVLGHQLEELG